MKKIVILILAIVMMFCLYKLYNYIAISKAKEKAISSVNNIDITKLKNIEYDNEVIKYANIEDDNYNCTYNYDVMDCYKKEEIIKYNEDYINDNMRLRALSNGIVYLTITKEETTDTLKVEDLNGNGKYLLKYTDYINKKYKDNIVYTGYGKFKERIECKVLSWVDNQIKYEFIYSYNGLIIKDDKIKMLGYEVGYIENNKVIIKDMIFELQK